jgi:hypothetical protein
MIPMDTPMLRFVSMLLLAGCSDAAFAVGAPSDDAADTGATGTETGAADADPGDSSTDTDTGSTDMGSTDTRVDTGTGPLDTGPMDTGPIDTGPIDTGKPDTCGPPLVDVDGDGEAPPPGICGTDCHDGNANVRSSQTGFFYTTYARPDGSPSWDYNCDGVATPLFATKYTCTPLGASDCTTVSGLESDVVPPCGAPVKVVTTCKRSGSTCVPAIYGATTQACH